MTRFIDKDLDELWELGKNIQLEPTLKTKKIGKFLGVICCPKGKECNYHKKLMNTKIKDLRKRYKKLKELNLIKDNFFDRDYAIYKKYLKGSTRADLSREYGISPRQITNILAKFKG